MPPKKPAEKAKNPRIRNKIIPTRLPENLVQELDEIAKNEKLTRADLLRRAAEAFVFNYKNDQLDQRQLKLEKRMQTMESALRSLMVKSIRLNGQIFYFSTLPWTQGFPKQRLNKKGFDMLYEKSAAWAAQYLKSKATGQLPEDLDIELSALMEESAKSSE